MCHRRCRVITRSEKMEEKPLLSVPGEETTPLIPCQQSGSRGCLRRDYCPCIPARYVLAVMINLGFAVVYGLRVNLSVAIVQMDNDTATVHHGSAKIFNWTESEQGWVLAAFFYGYLITQIPGGLLAQRVGGKWVYGVGVVMTAILTLFTTVAAEKSVWLLVALRVLEGFFEGVTYPASYAMWGKWAPSLERSLLIALSTIGSFIGAIISFILSGVLCEYGFDGGWPSVFYIFGIVGILWFFAWIFLAYSSPATHPRISKKEREYIESSIMESVKQLPTPWLEILISPAVWAMVIANFCYGWGFYILLTCMPTYFKQDNLVKSDSAVLTGVYSAIPYTTLFVVPLCGRLADFLRARYLPTVVVRKAFTFIAFTGGATFLLICGYLGTTPATAVLFLSLAVMFASLMMVGANTNQLDIAPKFAGVLMGITNMANTFPGFIGPQVAKTIAVEPNAPKNSRAYLDAYRDEWREVFVIAAEVYIFGAIAYLILASGEKQPWADGRRQRHTIEKQDHVKLDRDTDRQVTSIQ